MQMEVSVKVESKGALGRELRISVPSAEVDQRVKEQVRRMCKKTRLDGFRPGKVPPHIIEQRFGRQIFQDVTQDVIQESYVEALRKHQFNPAGQPVFEDVSVAPGEDVRFTARIDLYPEFEAEPMDGVKIEKPVATISDADVENMVERVRQGHIQWREVERPARTGDRLTVQFENLTGARREAPAQVVLGDESSAPESVKPLFGARRGDSRRIEIKGPAAQADEGAVVEEVRVEAVEEGKLPALDAAFFEACGVKEGGLEELRKMLRGGMQTELDNSLKRLTKTAVMNALLEHNPIELPDSLVRQEMETMRNNDIKRMNLTEADASSLPGDLYREAAQRRVKLGLLLHQFARQRGLTPKSEAVEAKLDELTAIYNDPESVKRYYRGDSKARLSVEAMVLEDEVVADVLAVASISEKTCSFDEAVGKAS